MTGECIPKGWVCDDEFDCRDKSDEVNCSSVSECRHNEFKCRSSVNPTCISSGWICDGDEDCKDGSDEFNCTAPRCKPNEFLCNKSRYLPFAL